MTVALCLAVCCVAYAVGGALVCVLANRDRPAGMPAAVYAACRSLRRLLVDRAAARLAARRPAQPRHTHRRTA